MCAASASRAPERPGTRDTPGGARAAWMVGIDLGTTHTVVACAPLREATGAADIRLFDIDQQFADLLPHLAQDRQVIAADFQGHGRTNDVDRPLTTAGLASDVVGLLAHLGLAQVDVFGFSIGGAVALRRDIT